MVSARFEYGLRAQHRLVPYEVKEPNTWALKTGFIRLKNMAFDPITFTGFGFVYLDRQSSHRHVHQRVHPKVPKNVQIAGHGTLTDRSSEPKEEHHTYFMILHRRLPQNNILCGSDLALFRGLRCL